MLPSKFALTQSTVAGEKRLAPPAQMAGFALSRAVMAMPGTTAAHVVLGALEVSRRNAQPVHSEIWKGLQALLLANLARQATTVRRELPTSSSSRAQPVDTAQQERQ